MRYQEPLQSGRLVISIRVWPVQGATPKHRPRSTTPNTPTHTVHTTSPKNPKLPARRQKPLRKKARTKSTRQEKRSAQGVSSLLFALLVHPAGHYILPLAPLKTFPQSACLKVLWIPAAERNNSKLHTVEAAQKAGN